MPRKPKGIKLEHTKKVQKEKNQCTSLTIVIEYTNNNNNNSNNNI